MNHISEKTISWSVTVYSTNLYSRRNSPAQIEPMQDTLKVLLMDISEAWLQM